MAGYREQEKGTKGTQGTNGTLPDGSPAGQETATNRGGSPAGQEMVTDYDYSAGHIRELLAVANLRKMSLPEHFDEASVDFLQKIYNGIGPEAWGGKFRARMTRLLAWLEAPALIHDWEYVCQPKTYAAFSRANLRLVWNAFKDGRFKIGLAAGILCQIGGWRGFRKTAEVSSGNLADYERLERLGSLGCLGKSDGIGTRNPTEVENDHL